MKTLILLLAIAAGIGFAVRATIIVAESAVAMPALTAERDDLQGKISHAQQRKQAAQQVLAASMAAQTAASVAAKPVPGKLSADAVIANNPKMMAETLKQFREISDYNQVHMFNALGLSVEQREKWKNLAVQMEQRRLDLVAAVESQGLDRKSDAYKTLSAENEKYCQATEAGILGDLEPAYREFQRTAIVRWPATWLAVTGLYTGETVTSDQVERVTQILAANSQRDQMGPQAGWVKDNTVNWSVANEQLKDVVSPSQIMALQALRAQIADVQKMDQQINQRVAALTAEFKGQPPSK